jgi:hypothetical protein
MRGRKRLVLLGSMIVAVGFAVLFFTPGGLGEESELTNMTRDDDVWVKWSVVSDVHEKDRLENGTLRFPAGHEWSWGLKLYNNKSVHIEEVVVVPKMSGAPVNFSLSETHASGPARSDFAYWSVAEAGKNHLVIMDMETHEDEKGPLSVKFMTFYSVDGDRRFSITEYDAEVEERGTQETGSINGTPPQMETDNGTQSATDERRSPGPAFGLTVMAALVGSIVARQRTRR